MYSLDADLKRKEVKDVDRKSWKTFIYYVVGHSVMKQLLAENEWTINIVHDSSEEIEI